MSCPECEKYKKMAKTTIDDLKKYVEADKEFKKVLGETIETIVNMPVEKPEMYFKYPERAMTVKDMMEWYDCVEIYYHIAQRYEAQERGTCCSVDRAYSKYLKPECIKLLEHFKSYPIYEGVNDK